MAKSGKVANFQQVQRVRSRPGEGTVIGYVTNQVAKPDGTTAVSLSLDLNSARVPDRRYVADVASVVREDDRLTFIFGQKQLGGQNYRSLVLLEMASTFVLQFIEASEKMVASIVTYAGHNHLKRMQLANINEDIPGQTVSFAANISSAGFTGRDACMDFYYASPFSVQIAGSGGEFAAEPVVRVNLPTMLMLALYEQLYSLKDSLPKEFQQEDKQ
jgi:hypothetical protein